MFARTSAIVTILLKIARIDPRILIHNYSQSVQKLFEIIFEDDDLLVVNKPAGLVCHPTKTDERSSLVGRARLYLGSSAAHLVNRLDRETSGVTLIAKNQSVAGALGKIWESHFV